MRRLSPVSVVVGGITDIVVAYVALFALMVFAALWVKTPALPKAEQTSALISAMQTSPSLQFVSWIIAGLCSVLGGYVAARLANRGELLNGGTSCWFRVCWTVYSLATVAGAMALWQQVLPFLMSPALGTLGGVLRLRQISRRQDLSVKATPI